MSKVRVRKETGKLYLDFMYAGHRCREQTILTDTSANRKQVEALLSKVQAKILLDELDYAEFFPGSLNLKKIQQKQMSGFEASNDINLDCKQKKPPLFSDFADQWFLEVKIQWRSSHTRNVESILESSLKPSFKNKRTGDVTKADILEARNQMARRKGRGASGLMSPKSINNHMTILRMILTEAADRYEFENPFRNIKPLKLQNVNGNVKLTH